MEGINNSTCSGEGYRYEDGFELEPGTIWCAAERIDVGEDMVLLQGEHLQYQRWIQCSWELVIVSRIEHEGDPNWAIFADMFRVYIENGLLQRVCEDEGL